MKKLKFQFSIGIVCFFLSFIVTWQYKGIRKFQRATEQESTKINKLQEDYKNEIDKNVALSQRIDLLNEEIKKYRGLSDSNEFSNILTEELEKIEMDAGITNVTGPGVIITLTERKNVSNDEDPRLYIVHDTTISDILNELKAIGAEALSLNGERIIATSEIRCAGPTVVVNGTRYCSPFEIKAIGKPENFEVSLKMPGGIVEIYENYIDITIKKSNNLKIEKFKGALTYKYAKKDE